MIVHGSVEGRDMRRTRWITAAIVACATSVTFFVGGGYVLSDDWYFARLIAGEHIRSPDDAFGYVRDHTQYPPEGAQLVIRSTPRDMLTRQYYLFCDQSAMVLATIVHKIGYQTALIDLVGPDGLSHHTVLGVREEGTWTTYDVTNNLERQALGESAKYHQTEAPFAFQPVYRPYPRFYHSLIQHNAYMKWVALWLRGLP